MPTTADVATTDIATAGLDNELRADLDETIDHLNANHADSVLLVARYAAGCVDADDAVLSGVDQGGVDFDVLLGDRRVQVRWSFGEVVASAADVRAQLYRAVGTARSAAGDRMPITSIEQERREQALIPTFYTKVAAVSSLNDGLLEVELEGGLGEFATSGGDQFFYMMMPRAGADPIPDGYTMADYMAQADDERPMGAYYTVRRWDAERRRMTIWVVVHGHDAGAGGWFERCRVGDRLVIWGPRHSFSPPVEARQQLLVADETGLAAVVALLEETPTGRASTVLLETTDEQHTIDLSGFPDATVRWLFRGDDEAGTGDALLRAVREGDLDPAGLVAFGAAESRQITAVRRYLRDEVGMPAASVFMTGYWRRADD